MSVRGWRIIVGGVALLVAALIIWVDLATDVWQKYVVISGLAGGLVTFTFTALIVDRFIARAAHERWEPVTRLALGDFRRRLSDPHEERRERRLPDPRRDRIALRALREASERERDRLIGALARWSSFLSSSADVEDIMDSIALVATELDRVDAEARRLTQPDASEDGWARLSAAIEAYHRTAEELIAHIDAALARIERVAVR